MVLDSRKMGNGTDAKYTQKNPIIDRFVRIPRLTKHMFYILYLVTIITFFHVASIFLYFHGVDDIHVEFFCVQCKVRFIDYGNMEDKLWTDLVELPKNLYSVKPMASKYALQGVLPAQGNSDPSFEKVSARFLSALNKNSTKLYF